MTFRNNRFWPLALAIGAMFVLQGLLNTSPSLRPLHLVLGPLAIFYGLWPRLILSVAGVTVVNVLPHTIAWKDLTSAEAVTSRLRMIALVLHSSADEKPLRSFAIRGSASGMLNSHELVTGLASKIEDERRRRNGVPASA